MRITRSALHGVRSQRRHHSLLRRTELHRIQQSINRRSILELERGLALIGGIRQHHEIRHDHLIDGPRADTSTDVSNEVQPVL